MALTVESNEEETSTALSDFSIALYVGNLWKLQERGAPRKKATLAQTTPISRVVEIPSRCASSVHRVHWQTEEIPLQRKPKVRICSTCSPFVCFHFAITLARSFVRRLQSPWWQRSLWTNRVSPSINPNVCQSEAFLAVRPRFGVTWLSAVVCYWRQCARTVFRGRQSLPQCRPITRRPRKMMMQVRDK